LILSTNKSTQTGYGLVLYTPFDVNHTAVSGNKTYDYTKYDNDGIVYNATWNAASLYGGAYEFDGVNDYVDVGNQIDNTLGN